MVTKKHRQTKNKFNNSTLVIFVTVVLLVILGLNPEVQSWFKQKAPASGPPALTTLEIVPKFVHLHPAEKHPFSYIAKDQYGVDFPITPKWSMYKPEAGAIKDDGTLTASSTVGTYFNAVKLIADGIPASPVVYSKVVVAVKFIPDLLQPPSNTWFNFKDITLAWQADAGTKPSQYWLLSREGPEDGGTDYPPINMGTATSYTFKSDLIEKLPDGNWWWAIRAKIDEKQYTTEYWKIKKKTAANFTYPPEGFIIADQSVVFTWENVNAPRYVLKIEFLSSAFKTFYLAAPPVGSPSYHLTLNEFNWLPDHQNIKMSIAGTGLSGFAHNDPRYLNLTYGAPRLYYIDKS